MDVLDLIGVIETCDGLERFALISELRAAAEGVCIIGPQGVDGRAEVGKDAGVEETGSDHVPGLGVYQGIDPGPGSVFTVAEILEIGTQA